MTVAAEPRERVILERLQERYEREGFDFYIYPPRDLLPQFLGKYRPDAIALKGNEKIVIEIKGRGTEQSPLRLSDLAKLFQQQQDWRLVVFNVEDFDRDADIRAYGHDEIEEALREVNHLFSAGQLRAAFVLGWATLEAAARALLERHLKEKVRPISANQMSEMLGTEGLVDQNSAKTLRDLSRVRNALVHGDLAIDINQRSIDSLNNIIRSLLNRLREDASSPSAGP
jgi:uncharacterized protein YutE (UPF0331/DUF86 family)